MYPNVHCRSHLPPSPPRIFYQDNLTGFQFPFIYSRVKRGTKRVECLAQEHNRMIPGNSWIFSPALLPYDHWKTLPTNRSVPNKLIFGTSRNLLDSVKNDSVTSQKKIYSNHYKVRWRFTCYFFYWWNVNFVSYRKVLWIVLTIWRVWSPSWAKPPKNWSGWTNERSRRCHVTGPVLIST